MTRKYNQGVADANRRRTKHGAAVGAREGVKNRLYQKWMSIKARCFSPDAQNYHRYGGRGITMCAEWANDFAVFREAVGESPAKGMTLDRIDNNGNYEPGNVRWATRKEQANNRETNVVLTFDGLTMTLKQWSEFLGCAYHTLANRWKAGERDPSKILVPAKWIQNTLHEWEGQHKTLTKWAEETGVPYTTLRWRILNKKPMFELHENIL